MSLTRFFWICFAGALGSGLRYAVTVWAAGRLGTTFPYGTLLVNVAGCFLMGFLMQLSLVAADFPVTLRLALTTGFLGGLTTYSSFNYETTRLLQDGARLPALTNWLATSFGCFAAGLLGLAAARRLAGS